MRYVKNHLELALKLNMLAVFSLRRQGDFLEHSSVKESTYKENADRKEKRKYMLQSWTKYLLRLSHEIAHNEKISIFHHFASINKIFILGGRLGTRLYFYEVLRFS